MSCKILRLRLSSYYKWTFWSKIKAQRLNYSLMYSFLLVQEWWVIFFFSVFLFFFLKKNYFISSRESFFIFFITFLMINTQKIHSVWMKSVISHPLKIYTLAENFSFGIRKKKCTSLEPLFYHVFSQFFLCIKRSFVSIYYGSILCCWSKPKL